MRHLLEKNYNHHVHELPANVPFERIKSDMDSYIQDGSEYPFASLELLPTRQNPVGAASLPEVTSDAAQPALKLSGRKRVSPSERQIDCSSGIDQADPHILGNCRAGQRSMLPTFSEATPVKNKKRACKRGVRH